MDSINEKHKLWWIFVWPIYRQKIKRLYEAGKQEDSENVIIKLFNDKPNIAKAIIIFLAKKHKWVKA